VSTGPRGGTTGPPRRRRAHSSQHPEENSSNDQPAHRHLTGNEVRETLHAYQHAHPRAWRRLAPLLGFPETPDDPRWPAVAETARAIVFTPRQR
jgi:hypothetical protein